MIRELLEKAVSLHKNRQWEESSRHAEKILELDPGFTEVRLLQKNNFVQLALKSARPHAIFLYEKALCLFPNETDDAILNNLAVLHAEEGRLTRAVSLLEAAILKNSQIPQYHNNRGSILKDQARVSEAIASFERATQLKNDYWDAHDNYLLTLHYLKISDEELAEKHRAWGELRIKPFSSTQLPRRTLTDRIRVGYVSGDFRKHSCAYFLESIVSAHDPNRFEIFLYANNTLEDEVTRRFQSYAATYRPIHHLSDDEATDLIRKDGIDILVDTSGHSSGNRLGIFARKPAVLQATYLGYPNVTGLPTIDYALTDRASSQNNAVAEKKEVLQPSFLCFTPPIDAGDVRATPALKNGFITFGSFNHLAKINSSLLDEWIRLLGDLPESRLFLKNKSFRDEETRNRFLAYFVDAGIDRRRLRFEAWTEDRRSHFDLYHEVDIALDTFPYNGTTTTCEALWMGVPVLTLEGATHVSRVSAHILRAIGEPSVIASSEEELSQKAKRLAENVGNLNDLRLRLRSQMQKSPLCDIRSFCRQLEAIYQNWIQP